jgi:hypothetical protein
MSKYHVEFKQVEGRNHYLVSYNTCKMGEFLVEVDGYFVYYPELRGGAWESWIMHEIADKLDELNAPWDAEVNRLMDKCLGTDPLPLRFNAFPPNETPLADPHV